MRSNDDVLLTVINEYFAKFCWIGTADYLGTIFYSSRGRELDNEGLFLFMFSG